MSTPLPWPTPRAVAAMSDRVPTNPQGVAATRGAVLIANRPRSLSASDAREFAAWLVRAADVVDPVLDSDAAFLLTLEAVRNA